MFSFVFALFSGFDSQVVYMLSRLGFSVGALIYYMISLFHVHLFRVAVVQQFVGVGRAVLKKKSLYQTLGFHLLAKFVQIKMEGETRCSLRARFFSSVTLNSFSLISLFHCRKNKNILLKVVV